MKPTILIVDDLPANLKVLRDALEADGYNLRVATSGQMALKIVEYDTPVLILLDIVMPGMDGYDVCRALKAKDATKAVPIIFITAKEEKEDIVKGFRVGGVDYITKPFYEEEVLARVATHLNISRLTRELMQSNIALREEIERREHAERDRDAVAEALQTSDQRFHLISEQEAQRWGIDGFIGQSHTIRKTLADIQQLQDVRTTSVLILGESGTGKELIARAVHFGGSRSKGPFIPVNCSAIPAELAESTFFGHVKGAFTGATHTRKGHFELASGGTLFLDELADMPLELQVKLLRVLEDGVILPIGDTREKHVDVRIIAATNADLQARLAGGTFRSDLYFRLARFTVTVPPLRERREDIPLLANHFIEMFAAEMGVSSGRGSEEATKRGDAPHTPTLSSEALEALMNYPFPGNVRELKNIIEHALIVSRGGAIQPEHLPLMSARHFLASQPDTTHEPPANHRTREDMVIQRSETDEEQRILAYLHQHGSITNAECRDLLGVDAPRATYLLHKMHRYGLLVRGGERRWARYQLVQK